MRMNRRNVLIGLGTIVAGGGAALGTGAFSTVEADRTVDLSTTGDGSALLALDDGGSELVTVTDDGDGQLELSSESLNQNALTRADGAIEVTNNGENDVGFSVRDDSFDVLDFEVSEGSIVGDPEDLDADDTVSVDLVIDLTDDELDDDIADEITFVADVDDHSTA
ncbi:hypothetical protein [Natrialba swarupiae]|uniref:DUF1102 domain-containing protein n=1 Tax=Natrialba swarupiae TaxID=2448032 RepID=A0A5D5AM38_9EURY|nr:hypothetical protein [Natrialba swarupiae]TYT61937.1 hypothetical protein FYC77_10700 [Natrialba swarupiae]